MTLVGYSKMSPEFFDDAEKDPIQAYFNLPKANKLNILFS